MNNNENYKKKEKSNPKQEINLMMKGNIPPNNGNNK